MTITLPPDIEQALAEQARKQKTTPEMLVLEALQEKFALSGSPFSLQALDDWEQLILSLGTDCGVSMSHQMLSSEGLYE
jgi:predicted transcriptional regulator